MDFEQARRFALGLPGTTEQPHFDMTSFRVLGKIFATSPADEAHLNVFVDEATTLACAAGCPEAFEPLLWGGKRRGVRVTLANAPADQVAELLEESWRRKASGRLIAELDSRR
jgi:hypothetical protein